jgi:hypothetical protein
MNIVVLTLGRSGSTVTAKMLNQLGWNLCGADQAYAENIQFRALNEKMIRKRGYLQRRHVESFLESLHEPWILKDPRFIRTWRFWRYYLDCGGTLLLHLTRDLKDVEVSMRKKGWGSQKLDGRLSLRGQTLLEADQECRCCYKSWNGPKMRIAYEDVHRAVRLFDLSQGNTK